MNEAKTVFPKLPPSSGVVSESAPTDLFDNFTTLLHTVVSSAPKQAVISSGSKLVSSLPTGTIPIHHATLEHENEFDIAFFRQKVKGMKNSEIEKLIKNVFVPDEFYTFPKTNGRSFRRVWLKSHSWLCYSPSLDGGFCLACVLFGDRLKKLSKIRKLFYEPVKHWPDAKACFMRHENNV